MLLPSEIINTLREYGLAPYSMEKLTGVNPNREVSSFRFFATNETSYIVKRCSSREYELYTVHGSFFEDNDIQIPTLYFSYENKGEHWILLEDIPGKFPQSRWKADIEQFDYCS
ncbi:hypothetical protein ACGTN9_19000 [Halobacillus sp. MO56]